MVEPNVPTTRKSRLRHVVLQQATTTAKTVAIFNEGFQAIFLEILRFLIYI